MPNTAVSLQQVCSHFNKYPDVLIAIIKHLHPEKLAGPIEQPKLAIPANNHVVVSFVSGKTPSSLDITLDPPIKDINDGYKRILALRNEAWLALDIPQSDEIRRSSNLPFSTSPRSDLTAGVYHPDTRKRAVQQLGNLHPGNGESARGTLVLTCFCAASGWSVQMGACYFGFGFPRVERIQDGDFEIEDGSDI
ncbi:hypothetical protein QFC24_003241 [Naganishia onofrii]|uniref:Uncharacterized protein n=1 Tax=Naganishia onofrii TaxID=1851511 RepID=A0ACC2XMF5_9TREE|nr:hypothetical protein QFC24_003241 [Naganishia onofrii]